MKEDKNFMETKFRGGFAMKDVITGKGGRPTREMRLPNLEKAYALLGKGDCLTRESRMPY